MALVQDELVVKVRAETSGMTKEFKKLRKALSKAFNQKQTTKDFKKLEEELADIRRLGMVDPFRNWGKSIENMEKKLKGVNAQTLKETQRQLRKNLIQYRKINKEADKSSKGGHHVSPDVISADKSYLKRVKGLRRKGFKYETDPDLSTMNYMMAKYGKKDYAYYEKRKELNNSLSSSGYSSYEAMQQRVQAIQAELNDSWNKELIRTGTKSPRIEALQKEQEKLEKLIESYEKLPKGQDGKFKEMQKDEASYYEEAKKAAEEQQKEEEEKKEQKSWKNRFKGLGRWFKQIGKSFFSQILGAMAIRKFISSILNQIKQGTQNLYEWSQYHNKEFATLMDKSKSMTVALGNAAALFKAYLTEWLTKLGTGLKELLIDALNALSKAIAWITGQKTYIQANKDIMAKWQQNNATTRQLIQGFDKLNIWNGNSDTLPKDMFTEYEFLSKQDTKEMGKQMAEGFVSYVLSSDPTFVGGGGMPQPTEENKSIWQRVKDFFSGIWEGLRTGWVKVKEWFNGIIQKIKLWWNGVTTEDEGENGEIITRQVEPGFKHALKEWFDTKVKGWWTGTIVPFFTNLWNEKLKPWFVEAWEKIKKWFDESIEPFMTKLADTLAKWWQNRKQVTNYKIEDWVYDKTGAVIDIEDTMRQFKRLMPWNWGKDLSEEVSFNAAGGVYTTPSLGVVGEASTRNNPELVTPTALLDDRLQANNRELLSAFNGMMNGVISAVNGISMEVKIGDDVIARSASRGNEAYYKQMGRPLIR